MKFFNTAGPCDSSRHYMLPARERLPEVAKLVDRGSYFVVHAPRQSGKTTSLRAWAEALTATGRYFAAYVSCERAAPYTDDVAAVNRTLRVHLDEAAERVSGDSLGAEGPVLDAHSAFGLGLRRWSARLARPLVLILDEIDALQGDGLRSVLHQLRADFAERPHAAPWSVILCGMRDVKDYRDAGSAGDRLNTSSPFNVKVKSLRIDDFGPEDIANLYGQHTAEGGATFSPAAIQTAHELTGGQPWLVNALAAELIDEMEIAPPAAIEAADVRTAAERLIRARATHIDSLGARLDEPRVRSVLEPLVSGTLTGGAQYGDDLEYLRDLGLVAIDPPVRVANPIYREVILRTLASRVEDQIQQERRHFITPEGRLDIPRIFEEFGQFWRQHGELLAGEQTWHEIAAQLVLMAYLQRVVNGGGQVEREYGVGRGRIDMLIRWPIPGGEAQREAIELKAWRDGGADPQSDGLAQLSGYLERLGLNHGWLAIFDRRAGRALPEGKLTWATGTKGQRIGVWRG